MLTVAKMTSPLNIANDEVGGQVDEAQAVVGGLRMSNTGLQRQIATQVELQIGQGHPALRRSKSKGYEE